MRFWRSAIFCLALLLGSPLILLAQSIGREKTKLATDPLFDIPYAPKQMHYELLSQSVIRKCYEKYPSEMREAINHRFGIFAHAHSGAAEYYVVDATVPYYNEYGWIDVLLVNGDKCTVSSSDWAFTNKPSMTGYKDKSVTERIATPDDPDIKGAHDEYTMRSAHEEEVMRNLARDAIQRGIAAHGSDIAFRKLACPSLDKGSSYPVLYQELRAYCK